MPDARAKNATQRNVVRSACYHCRKKDNSILVGPLEMTVYCPLDGDICSGSLKSYNVWRLSETRKNVPFLTDEKH